MIFMFSISNSNIKTTFSNLSLSFSYPVQNCILRYLGDPKKYN